MYTQCPDCSTAFRVTAEVLKQAAGKVRCGGCGNAFNALSYLSETLPEQAARKDADEALPELKPETLKDKGVPASISAEQSAALLKTLDELAGSDIRIEDTGVEWRVLDDDERGDAAADEPPEFEPIADEPPAEEPGGFVAIDEVLEESPTPVDQFLTETPAIVDSPEIFEESAEEFSRTSVDEIRFDDNTPLPDDFNLDDDGFIEGDFLADSAPLDEEPEALEDVVEEEQQADLDLSEPDEWTDILGEFEDLAEAVSMPLDAELEALEHAESDEEPEELTEITADEELEELTEIAADEEPEELTEVAAPAEDSLEADSIDDPLDMDAQFALQAEAMGIDLSGVHESLEAAEESPPAPVDDIDAILNESNDGELDLDDLLDEELVEEIHIGEFDTEPELDSEPEAEAEPEPEPEPEPELELHLDPEEVADLEFEDELEDELDDELEDEPEDELEDELDAGEDTQLDLIDETDDSPDELEFEDSAESDEPEEPDEPEVETDEQDDYHLPPMTEEEQTINMQIDQDLLALAVEDEDGFASTMILPEDGAEEASKKDKKKSRKDKKSKKDKVSAAEEALKDTSAGFETIIMEGEDFRSTEDLEKLEADTAAAALLAGAAAAEREAEMAAKSGGMRYGIIGGIVVLALLLAGQYVHQSRNTLATIPAFNSTVGPMYRAIGQPLSPAWDITGWRFEATKGSTDDGDENLTVYSRIGNDSDNPLPYPLIGISLTDRFEETIGSRVLDPADYLPSNLDPRKLVQPGNTFNAVITIESPAEEATGFKLNVCYRESGGNLRCAIDDFK